MPRGGSNEFLTPDELADYLRIERRTLMRSYKGWGLKAHTLGRKIRFRVRDVDHWLTTREQQL